MDQINNELKRVSSGSVLYAAMIFSYSPMLFSMPVTTEFMNTDSMQDEKLFLFIYLLIHQNNCRNM